ncbi:MAG: hypothetical protein Ct9H90mP1_1770 [Methanobacteriota archaeon]|nr:MAG: hypothetical protein Ct9H90mP1_1770 [Euryarchaeota archaeon]
MVSMWKVSDIASGARVELEIHVVVLAPCHVLADVGRDADAVVCPYSRLSTVSTIVWLPGSISGLFHPVWHSQLPSDSSSQSP